MIIERMKANFGGLNGRELNLRGGLNIVYAANEAGKSTWMGFIRAMLYGIDTSEKDRQGHIAAKNKFRPWSGAPMEGVMDVIAWDRPVRLTRETVVPTAPLRKFSAVFTDMGDPVSNISGESAGQRLIGVEESVFVRSCFIGQRTIDINQSPELERRIAQLVTTGDETTSYTEAETRLRQWKNQIKYNRSGELPRVEERIAELENLLERQKELNRESGELRARILRLRDSREELSKLLRQHETIDRAEDIRRRYEAYMQREKALAKKREADDALRKYEKVPTLGALNSALDRLRELNGATEACESRRALVQNAREAEEAAREKRENFPVFGGMEPEAAWKQAEEDASSLRSLAPKSKPKTALIIISWILAAAAGAASWVYLILPAAAAVSGVCALAALIFTIANVRRSRKNAEAFSEITAKYGGAGPDAVLRSASDYRAACDALVSASEALAKAENEFSSESERCDKLREAALSPLRELVSNINSIGEAEKVAREAIYLIEAQSKAGTDLREAEKLCSAVGEYRDEELIDVSAFTRPAAEKEQVVRELAETRAQLENSTAELARNEGAILQLGDPAALSAELSQLKERREELSLRLRAIEGTIEVLAKAEASIRQRFSPKLNKRAGDILGQITGGRYPVVMLDRSFSAEAVSSVDVAARSALMLSAGTLDQIYLALRLAVCDLVLPESLSAPVILDDSLAFFDDERMAMTLEFLRRYAEKRQVIFFTCRRREAEYFSDSPDVNIAAF